MLRSTVHKPSMASLTDETEEFTGFKMPVLRPMTKKHEKSPEDRQAGGFNMPVLRPVKKAKIEQKQQKTVGFMVPENRPMKKPLFK